MSMKLQGFKELSAQLAAIAEIGGTKPLARAARKAMVPVRDEAKRLVRKRTTILEKSIRIAAVKPRTGSVVVSVGLTMAKQVQNELPVEVAGEVVDVDVETLKGAGWRWHFVEFGVPIRHIPAHPFLRPAFESNVGRMLDILKSELQTEIGKAIAKKNAPARAPLGGLWGD